MMRFPQGIVLIPSLLLTSISPGQIITLVSGIRSIAVPHLRHLMTFGSRALRGFTGLKPALVKAFSIEDAIYFLLYLLPYKYIISNIFSFVNSFIEDDYKDLLT
jgi:hypothetical protein